MAYMCNCCDATENQKLYENYDRMYVKLEIKFSLVRCGNCGLISIWPVPTESQIAEFYPKGYGAAGSNWKTKAFERMKELIYGLQARKDALAKIQFVFLLPIYRILVNRGLPAPEGRMKLLDIGCGNGRFLRSAKKAGYEAFGVEPFVPDLDFALKEGITVLKTDVFGANFSSETFDVITLNHVIEHVRDPNALLAEVTRILKPKGKIYLGTPNTESAAFRVFGKYWYNLDTPRHLHIMGVKNIREYAKRYDLEVVEIRYTSTYMTYQGSVQYIVEGMFGIGYKLPTFLRLFFIPFQWIIAELTNAVRSGDLVEAVLIKARKKNFNARLHKDA